MFATTSRLLTTTAQTTIPRLVGTVPSHKSYAFIQTVEPPSQYPARLTSPLQRALQLQFLKLGALVNFSWSQSLPANHTIIFSARGRLEISDLSLDTLPDHRDMIYDHITGDPLNALDRDNGDDINLYVCAHGARDCRCGDTGTRVAVALREEIALRRKRDPHGPIRRVRDLAQTAHVGGHEHAANLLVFPQGEWLGRLTPEDVPQVLDAILGSPPGPSSTTDPPLPLCPSHWRGRMGLSKDEQIGLWSSHYS